LKKNQVCLHD